MSIRLRINGRDVELSGPTPLPEYLGGLGVDARAVAVELNERILERSELPAAVLRAGDVVEIVRMVGGGKSPTQTGGDAGAEPGAERAAHKAVAPDRVLPGERLESLHPEDALHWAGVYRELIQFKDRAIDAIVLEAVSMSDTARIEVESTDLVVMRAERDRFRRRAGFWRSRYQTLTGSQPADPGRGGTGKKTGRKTPG